MNVAPSYQRWTRPKHTNKIGLTKSNSLTLVVFYYILPAFHFQKAPRYHLHNRPYFTPSTSKKHAPNKGADNITNL